MFDSTYVMVCSHIPADANHIPLGNSKYEKQFQLDTQVGVPTQHVPLEIQIC